MSRIVGIDLGTTNSLVAAVEGDRPRILVNQRGSRTTPSVVRFLPDGHTEVGAPAQRARIQDPTHTVTAVQRFIGRHYNEIADLAALVPYAVVSAADAETRILMYGRELSPEQISALVLDELRQSAQIALGEKVSRAVITVPAYFNDSQCRATARAAELAGLHLERLIAEPTAAAMAHSAVGHEDLSLVVLDLGGGTYDVSVLEV